MLFRTSDNVSIIVNDEGSGKTVVLLSGYSGIKEEWKYQKKFLLDCGYRVITMDWRNHGESMRTHKNLRIYRLAADVAEIIDHLMINDAIFVGHSMGASVIWAYVSLFGEKKIDRVITIDQSPKLINDKNWEYGIKDVYWENFWINAPLSIRRHMNALELNTEFVEFLKQKRAEHPFDYELNQDLLVNHMEQDWRDVIATIRKPQIFVAGACSPLWSSEHAFLCQRLAQDAEVAIVEKAGHLVHMEAPEKFNQILLNSFK